MMMRMVDGDSTSPLVDRFNSLLALLRLPVQLPGLGLATPTLLLTVLEAILETRIVDVPAEWRADSDPATRRKVVQYLLRAIHQVTLGIKTRTGSVPPSEVQMRQLEPRKIVDQDEQSLETVLKVLLWIADALDIKSRPPPPPSSAQRQRTVRVLSSSPPLPPNDGNADSGVASESKQGKLFSRQSPMQQPPRRLRTALSDTSSPSKHRLAATHKPPPSTTASEPDRLPQLERSASPPPLRAGSPPTTPTRRDRLSTVTTTSLLAELARARSPAQASASWSQTSIEGDAARPPPISPKKSIVEVMRSLELRRTEHSVRGTNAVDRRPKLSTPRARAEQQDPIRARDAESAAHPCAARSGTKLRPDLATSSSPPPPSSASSSATSSASRLSSRPPSNRKTARQRSGPKEADGRLPNGGLTIDPLPPCTCTCSVSEKGSTPSRHPQQRSPSVPSASPSSTAASTSAPPSRQPRERSRSGSPAWPPPSPASSTPTRKRTPPPHRVRVSRISPTTLSATAASNTPTSLESGLLSVQSSTDLDLDLDSPPDSRPPARSAAPCTPPPPIHPSTILYGAGSTADTPSPYTLLLLAHRDRLREKLRILERREKDRKAAAEAMMGAERQKVVPLPGGGPGMPAGVAV